MLDAAVETWISGSPIRDWVVVPIAAYLVLTLWLLSQGARLGGGGWFMQPFTPVIVLLAILAATTGTWAATAHGLVVANQPTSTVLAVATLCVVLLAGLRLVGSKSLHALLRLVIGLVTAYAVAALLLGIRSALPYSALLHGHGFWQSLPYWLQGAFLGSFVILPLALVAELGVALARLVLGKRIGWILAFGLALWIAYNGFTP